LLAGRRRQKEDAAEDKGVLQQNRA